MPQLPALLEPQMGYFFKNCEVMEKMETKYNVPLHLKKQIDSLNDVDGINFLFTNAFEVLYEGEESRHLKKHLNLVKLKVLPAAELILNEYWKLNECLPKVTL
jgi:hypothetical protein